MQAEPPERAIGDHYRRNGLAEAIPDALRAAGKVPEASTTEKLALIDQFHTRGRAATLDLARTQHSSMNIADKETPYQEIRRVLRPEGRLALHEIMAGPYSPIHFSVPWARELSISYLHPPKAIRALISASGFTELVWRDETAQATDWFRQRLPATSSGGPPLGLPLLLGPEFGEMLRNQVRNLEESRISVVQAVFERP